MIVAEIVALVLAGRVVVRHELRKERQQRATKAAEHISLGGPCLDQSNIATGAMIMRRQGKSVTETAAFFGNKSNAPSIVRRAYKIPLPISHKDGEMFSMSTFEKCMHPSSSPTESNPCDDRSILAFTVMDLRLKGVTQSNAEAQIKRRALLGWDPAPESTSMSIIAAAYSAPMPKSRDDSGKFALQTHSQCLWKRGIFANEIQPPCVTKKQLGETAMRLRMHGKTQAETLAIFGTNADAPPIVQTVYSQPLGRSKDEARNAGANAMLACMQSEMVHHFKRTACDSQMSLANTVMNMRESGLSQSEAEARLAHGRPISDDFSAVPASTVSTIVAAAYRAPLVVPPEDVTTAPSDSPYGEFVRQIPGEMLAAYSFAQQTRSRCTRFNGFPINAQEVKKMPW